ncbi:hypothetical protein LZ32DRAFT_340887 [Colletotrichum eremochloae]|nr:hypothetical protein LZ32DRAFT_340887 [Colletotrichum eremochloae]
MSHCRLSPQTSHHVTYIPRAPVCRNAIDVDDDNDLNVNCDGERLPTHSDRDTASNGAVGALSLLSACHLLCCSQLRRPQAHTHTLVGWAGTFSVSKPWYEVEGSHPRLRRRPSGARLIPLSLTGTCAGVFLTPCQVHVME